MKLEYLSKEKSKEIIDSFRSQSIPSNYFEKLSNEYQDMRSELLSFYDEKKENYDLDLNFALKLYEYFSSIPEFDETIASNYDFWRYVCIKVVPDIIYKRHGWVDAYFYEKNVRMYIPTMWWYIHLCYQGDIEKTYEILKGFNTDYIMQLVERPGRDGMYLNISRAIMKKLSSLPKKIQNQKINGVLLYRRVLIQNTAKANNYNLVIEGKENDYVEELFSSCGVNE